MNTAQELQTVTALLDLEEFEVVAAADDWGARRRRLTVVPKAAAGLCPQCGRLTEQRHACRERMVADLPLGGWKTELVVCLWQFHCPGCDRFFTPRFAALAEGAHATERLLERLADLASHGDIRLAARFFGLPEKTVEGWYYAYLQRRQQERDSGSGLQPVTSLGIDELALKKDTGSSAAC